MKLIRYELLEAYPYQHFRMCYLRFDVVGGIHNRVNPFDRLNCNRFISNLIYRDKLVKHYARVKEQYESNKT